MAKITIIAAVAQNRAIGFENKLLYWLPNDLKRFKALTTGHTIVMGRKTFESFPKGALPNRRNVVLTRNENLQLPGAECFTSLEAALASCQPDEHIYIIGGDSVYQQAMPLADELCLTRVEDTPAQADAFFPEVKATEWEEVSIEEHAADEKHQQNYSFVNYKRI
ncbi:MAG: dihydrofolate reductase [Bacteroidaceae bacterium]|nr:dihydrofolate reductase [Bacteroidaceae bacterium]